MHRAMLFAWVFVFLAWPARTVGQTTALFYGNDVPAELARAYDRLVVAPEAVPDPRVLEREGATIYAYVSVGERPGTERGALPEAACLGQNEAWSTVVMDVRDGSYREALLERVVRPLFEAGYRHLFLDTLDAPIAFLAAPRDRELHWDAIVSLVEEIHARFPDVTLLVNRGFEAMDRLAPRVDGVVAESLFDRWNAQSARYERVPEIDRSWLIAQLTAVRDRHHLPVTVVDYRPPHERDQARDTARRIGALGFGAWVTDYAISSVGVGVPELLPRRVLLLWDRRHAPRPEDTMVHRYIAPILEYLGLVPEMRELGETLPRGILRGRYAGVVAAIDSPHLPSDFDDFVATQRRDGTPFVLLADPGALPTLSAIDGIGIDASGRRLEGEVRVEADDSRVGFEARPVVHRAIATELHVEDESAVALLRLEDQHGRRMEPVVSTSWGAFALSPYLFAQLRDGSRRWVVDPFAFFRESLRLPEAPAPDLTTENGSRILVAEVLGGRSRPGAVGSSEGWRRLWRAVLRGRETPHTLYSMPHAARPRGLAARWYLRMEDGLRTSLASPPTFALGAGPSVTEYSPILCVTSSSTSVYAPYADDSAYVETGVAYAYARVVDRLAFGDGARRMRAIGLRYHVDQASTSAGVGALRTIYAWLDQQQTIGLHADEFAARARAFGRVTVLRFPDGSFELRALGALRTVRTPARLGFPDGSRYPDIAVVAPLRDGTYVSFAPAQRARIGFVSAPGEQPEIRRFGAQLEHFERSPGRIVLRAQRRGRFEIELVAKELDTCEAVDLAPLARVHGEADGRVHVTWESNADGSIEIRCRPRASLASRRTR